MAILRPRQVINRRVKPHNWKVYWNNKPQSKTKCPGYVDWSGGGWKSRKPQSVTSVQFQNSQWLRFASLSAEKLTSILFYICKKS